MTHLSPQQLADRWNCSAEHVQRQIRSGRLQAFSLSRPGAKRPRWRIPFDAVLAFENANAARPPAKPVRRRRRLMPEVVQFYK